MSDPRAPEDHPPHGSLKEMGDGELVRLLARRYGEAMTVVFDRYYAPMMRLALRTLRNRAEAEDVVQVAFADFYRQIELFDDSKGSLRSWLLQYVYGRSINRLKAMKTRRHADHIELSEAPPGELAAPRTGFLDLNEPEVRRFVQQILARLPEEKRWVVELVCLDGMTIREVAALTGEPITRIQNRYYRAITALRGAMKKAEGSPEQTAELEVTGIEVRRLSPPLKAERSEVKIG